MRQTGWAYLELRGHPPRKAPTLSEVRDLLLADGSRLALLIADALRPEWRNPAAHEEHYWDAAQERIVVGQATATLDDIEAATGYAMSVMHGFETGLACARLLIDELAQKLEGEHAVHEAPLVDLRVRNAIGRQGVYVWDTNWRGDSVEVVLEWRRLNLLLGNSSPEEVLTALDAYCNPDGGYGWALEPDLRSATSQPVAAMHALEVLAEVCDTASQRAVRLCNWLADHTLPDGGIPFALPYADTAGSAPFWANADATVSSLQMTAQLGAQAHRLARHRSDIAGHPWLAAATTYCLMRSIGPSSPCTPTS